MRFQATAEAGIREKILGTNGERLYGVESLQRCEFTRLEFEERNP